MSKRITATVEKYLKGIYRLQERNSFAKTSDLIKMFDVSPGTITNTIKRLKIEGLVIHQPYKGVKLTEKGREIAIQAVRRHRIVEQMLTEILQVELTEAHKIAGEIEHYIPDSAIKRIKQILDEKKAQHINERKNFGSSPSIPSNCSETCLGVT